MEHTGRKMTDPRQTSPPADNAGHPTGIFQSTALEQSLGTYLPATVAVRLLNFGRILILTWFMTRQQFGLFTMVLLVANVLTPLCSLGLSEAVARYLPQHEQQGSVAAFARKSCRLLLAFMVGSVALILLFSPALGELFFTQQFSGGVSDPGAAGDALRLARLSGVVIGLLVIYFYLLALVKGLRMFSALSRLELSHSLLFLGGCGLMILTGDLSAPALTAIYAVSLVIPIAYFSPRLIHLFRHWQAQAQPLTAEGISSKLLKFSIWTTLAGVTWQVLIYYPAWFLNKVHGHEAVAVFGAVRQVGQFVLIAAMAVATVVITTVTNTWESRGRPFAERQLSLAFRGTCLGLWVLCAVVVLFKDLIILMFSPAYGPGAAILPLQTLFFLLGAFLAFLPGHFHLQEKTRYMFWPLIAGVSANVLLAYWLAGPQQAAVQTSDAWQAVGRALSMVVSVGFSDPQGLYSAAWCGVLAMFVATAMCVLLIRAKCCRLDRGSYIVIAASVLLVTKPWILSIGGIMLILTALRTELIFQAEERRRIIGYVFESLRHIPALGRLGPKD